MNDNVNHPQHYIRGGIETIDVIKAFTSNLVGMEAVCTGNALKYLCRWKEKNGLEDLKKAEWYLKRLISEVEAADEDVKDEDVRETLNAIKERWSAGYTASGNTVKLGKIFELVVRSRVEDRSDCVYALHIPNCAAWDLFVHWYLLQVSPQVFNSTEIIDYYGLDASIDDTVPYDAGWIKDYSPYDIEERTGFDDLWMIFPISVNALAPNQKKTALIFSGRLPSPSHLEKIVRYHPDPDVVLPINDIKVLEVEE